MTVMTSRIFSFLFPTSVGLFVFIRADGHRRSCISREKIFIGTVVLGFESRIKDCDEWKILDSNSGNDFKFSMHVQQKIESGKMWRLPLVA